MIAAVFAALLLCPAASANRSDPPELSAECAILMDAESGRVLFEKNPDAQRPIASITKLVTALVAAELITSPQEPMTIRPEWTGAEGSSIYLRAGETVTPEILLYGLLLSSGNDAAVALAGYCAGDVDAFVERMNARAQELGMAHTRFMNPNGLNEEGHCSTARDMALAARACLRNETVAKIAATRSITLGTRTFTNHNKLLWRYPGCIGMKTGYTEASGRTLVSAAQRDGQTLIAVTLNAPDDWADHTALLDYGFEHFSWQMLCQAGTQAARVPVRESLVPSVALLAAETVSYPLAPGERVETRVCVREAPAAPVAAGEVLGRLEFCMNGQRVGECTLVSAADVRRDAAEPRSALRRILDRLFP